MATKKEKLQALSDAEGKPVKELLQDAVLDTGPSMGICINDGCSHVTPIEPDCEDGWCEVCKTHTIQSACVLALIM